MPVELVAHDVTLPARFPWQERAAKICSEPAARFIALGMGRQSGKTTFCADYAGEFGLEQPSREIAWIGPNSDIAGRGLDRFMELWEPAKRDYRASEKRFTFWNGSSVYWRSADTPNVGISRTNDLVIVDEASRVGDDALKRALIPTVMVRRGKILAPSTPRGNRNWFAEWARRAMSGDWPSYRFATGPSTENPLPHVRAFVDDMRRDLPERLFRQEFLGEFVDDAGLVFRNIRECATSTLTAPREGHTYVLGCDLAKHEDYTVLAPLDFETGECGPLVRFHRLSWPQMTERIETERLRWNQALLYIDSTGVGDPIYDQLHAANVPVYGLKFTSDSKAGLIVGLATAIERGDVAYHDDPGLIAELQAFGYEQLPSGRYRYGGPEGMHDDRVIALALAVYGRASAPHHGLMRFYQDSTRKERANVTAN